MQGERDRAVQAAGRGELVPNLQHPPLSHFGTEGRRAGSGAKPFLGGISQGVKMAFLGG